MDNNKIVVVCNDANIKKSGQGISNWESFSGHDVNTI